MNLDEFLTRLKNVKGGGAGQYTARCPAHEDKQNSLSVSSGEGKIVLHCHAGCHAGDVLAALGLSMRDLFEKPPLKKQKPKKEIDKIYDYTDEDGNILHSTIRYKCPKGFSQRRPDPVKKGKFIYSLKGIQTVIYNLPLVKKAIKEGSPIFIAEGEKDAETLAELRFAATSSPMGATKWRNCYSDCLAGANIYIVPDNDEAGRQHAKAVAESVSGKASSINLIDLKSEMPELPEHGDITDFLNIILQKDSGADLKAHIHELMKKSIEFTETAAEQKDIGKEVYPCPVFVNNNSYYVIRGKAETRLTNFIMEPLELIECIDGGAYTIRFTTDSGKQMDKQVISAVFSGERQFKQMLKRDSLELSYIGSDVELEHVQEYMLREYPNHPRKQGIGYTGLVKKDNVWLYVDANGAVGAKMNFRADIMSVIPDNASLESCLYHTELITSDELKRLSLALFHFNTYQRTVPIISWVTACFLKERLAMRKIKYSHLGIFGQKGDGKSETSDNIIQPIFCMKGKATACKETTNFSLMKTCHCTNLIPVILEEFKPSFLTKIEINLISNALRSAYDGQAGQRGKADQSVVNYVKRAPMLIIGENSIDEAAVKERCIEVQFGKADRTEHHTECFKFLSANERLLNKLGAQY